MHFYFVEQSWKKKQFADQVIIKKELQNAENIYFMNLKENYINRKYKYLNIVYCAIL